MRLRETGAKSYPITTKDAEVKVVSQRLPGVTIDAVTQDDSDPLVAHTHRVISGLNDYGFWKQLAERSNATATDLTPFGGMHFDPNAKFSDIPI